MTLISLNNIIKTYGSNNNLKYALNELSLQINSNEMIAIMGPSGAGKSTLLNIIGCIDKPSSGEYYIQNNLINNYKNSILSKFRNERFGFIFQKFALIQAYSVIENVELPLTYRKISSEDRKKIALKYLTKLGIENYCNKMPNELSGGEQQKVAIARALAQEPTIILADEPTGSLDQKSGEEIMTILKNINKLGKCIIIVTHDNKVASYCDRTILMIDGKIVSDSNYSLATLNMQ